MDTFINTTNNLFYLPETELFSELDTTFFAEVIKPENQEWLLSHISDERDEAENLHHLAEAIRLEIVEQYQEEIDKLSNVAYREILQFAVASTDSFKLAREIYQQYRKAQPYKVA